LLEATGTADTGQVFRLAPSPAPGATPAASHQLRATGWIDTPEQRERWAAWLAWKDGKGPRPPADPFFVRPPKRKGPSRAELLEAALTHPSGPVSGLILTGRQSVKGCTPQSELVRCGCRWRKVQSCCMDRDCTECAAEVGRRRAKRVLERLRRGLPEASHPVAYTVLTVPPAERRRFVEPAAWRALARKAWRVLRRDFGALFGVEATHPVGDAGEKMHVEAGEASPDVFHPHLNFLWVRATYWGQIDLDLLRRRWAAILGVGDAPVSVYHGFRHDGGKLQHTVRYATRTFPGWGFWLPSMRWYGKFPKSAPAEPKCCDACGELFRVVARGATADQLAAQWTAAGLPAGERVRKGRAPPWGDS